MGQKVTRTCIVPHFHTDAYVNTTEQLSLSVYAIGDVHGESELLANLLAEIFRDIGSSEVSRAKIIFLGDYIDRGANSKGVVDLIVSLKGIVGENGRIALHCLLGNHEKMLSDFLNDAEAGCGWLSVGGVETLLSYGVPVPYTLTEPDAWKELQDRLARAMPQSHRAFFDQLERKVVIGDFAFVHAGVSPNLPLDLQTEEDMLWIRKPFLDEKRPFEKIIVHGHTPVKNVEVHSNRVCIDTGAFATGVLSALKINRNEIEIFQSSRERG